MKGKTMSDTVNWEKIEESVSSGRLVVLPTDTVYGIGCDPYSRSAVANLLGTKRRGQTMPPPVLAPNWESALGLANWELLPSRFRSEVREQARTLARKYWPGALTLIVPTTRNFGWDMETHGKTVAVRVPDEPLTLRLLKTTGPLAVTSANLTGQSPALTVSEAQKYFGNRVDYYLDGGTAKVGKPSTILDATTTPMRMIRAGALDWEDIKRTLEDTGVTSLG